MDSVKWCLPSVTLLIYIHQTITTHFACLRTADTVLIGGTWHMACVTRSSNLHHILHLDVSISCRALTSNQRRRRNLGGGLAQWESTIAPLVNSFDALSAETEQAPTF